MNTPPSLSISHLDVTLGKSLILSDISLTLEKAEIGCLLGPSGCGKTTLLRSIAGFIQPTAGEVSLAGNKVSDTSQLLPVEKRNVGMVFQDFALFPHLTVYDNIVFGLKNANMPPAQQKARAEELLELIELSHTAKRYPHQLSGGQQQRVALARALAPKPSVMLLDEPFSSIDRTMRDDLALKVREILKKEQATTVMVTHDQAEAYAMADKIGVMKTGKLHQWDSPFDVYHEPKDKFVAGFIGESVFISAKVLDAHTLSCDLGQLTAQQAPFSEQQIGKEYQLLLRPDDVLHDDASPIKAKVIHKFFKGSVFVFLLELASGEQIYAHASAHHPHQAGEMIGIRPDVHHLVLF